MNIHILTDVEVTKKMIKAFELEKAKETREALDAFLIVGKNTKQQRTEGERLTYMCSQTMACKCYETLGRYKDAYLLAKTIMQDNISVEEKEQLVHLYVFNGYMYAVKFLHNNNGQFAKARSILEEIVPYADGDIISYIASKIPLSWYFEGVNHHLAQEYDEALECYQHAIYGYRELKNIKNELSVLKQIAAAKMACYDVFGSEETYHQALSLSKKIGDAGAQMDILKELWKIRNTIGDVQLAQKYAANMDSLIEATSDLQIKYSYYNQKGNEAKGQRQFRMAELWYLRGKELVERNDSTLSLAYRHDSYTKLRDLYAVLGRYEDALLYANEAIEVYQSHLSKDDTSYNFAYIAVADIYCKKGDKTKCYRSLERLFAHIELLTEPKELQYLYITRGKCYFEFKEYETALNDYKKAEELLATKYPHEDGDRVALLALIGGTENRLGHYEESERYYRMYGEYVKRLYGKDSMEHIYAKIYIANAEGFTGHLEEGCKDYVQAVQQLKALIKRRIPYMSSVEREGLWFPLSSLFTMMTPYALKAKQYQTVFTKSCYDALVMSKSFLLESERSMYDVIKRMGTAKDMYDYTLLANMKNQVKEWGKNYKINANNILNVSRKVSRLENQLVCRCNGYSNGTNFMDVDYDTVRQALGQNEVLVDFTDFVHEKHGRRYAAYIINNAQDNPVLKHLFDESQIDSLGIARPDLYYEINYAQDLLQLLWEPLKDYISDGTTVYYVPSQLLFQMSLESLPLADGSLLGKHYNFVRLSSARELLKMKVSRKNLGTHTAVLYGGLQYDIEQTAMVEEARKYDLADFLDIHGDIIRGDSLFRELPGSKEEVIKIEFILKMNKWQVKTYMGKEGSEESFLAMHGKSPHILHIATHGFYYTPDSAGQVNYLKGYTDAMSLSGLVLSGGNAAWLGKPLSRGILGGILSANDIARIDLSNTDMVVLSACKSGQGKATPEGLYGLQRAFKKAGVGTIVMSLWNVDDKVTSEFMVTFYEYLANAHNAWDKRKAFETAKTIIRMKHPAPFHWAAFVMLD